MAGEGHAAEELRRLQHGGNVVVEGGESISVLGFPVVGLVGQGKPGLAEVHNVAAGVFCVLVNEDTQEPTNAHTLQFGEGESHAAVVSNGGK